MVVTRKKVERSNFRKIPFGAPYWTVAGIGSAPVMKIGRRSTNGGDTLSTGKVTRTAVSDTTVVVIRVPRGFTYGQGRYAI